MVDTSGSQLEMILSSRGHVTMETFLGVITGGQSAVASSG